MIRLCMIVMVSVLPLLSVCSRTVPVPASITTSGIPPIPKSIAHAMERYQNNNYATFVGWHPQGRGVIVLRQDGDIAQLYTIAEPLAPPKQLTSSVEPVIGCELSLHAAIPLCLYTHDKGGNENFQISAVNTTNGTVTPFTQNAAQNGDMLFSHRGDRFAWSSNKRNGIDADIYISSVDSFTQSVPVCTLGGAWSVWDWSPGDTALLLMNYRSRTSSLLYTLSLHTGTCRPLCDSSDTVSQEVATWGKEGIFFTSDKDTDFRCLHFLPTQSGHDTLLTHQIPWDVREVELSRDGATLAFATNEHGFSQLYLMNTATYLFKKVTTLPRGIITHFTFSTDDRFLGMTVTTPAAPDDVYELDCETFAVRKWTDNKPSSASIAQAPSIDVITYPAFDTVADTPRQIPCLVYTPAVKQQTWPVLIVLHGGPESQFWPSFKPDLLFYLNELGIAVIAPNVRGSGGYGKKYLTLDNGVLRENAVRDVGSLIHWTAQQPEFDASRILLSGGSYGGYLVLASMVAYSRQIRAGIDTYGIANFITYFEKTAPYRRDLRRVEYGDERIPAIRDFLERISPVNHVDKITKPLLIVQGANDARVPLYESEQMAAALRKQGIDTWLLVANDEGHGFRREQNVSFQRVANAYFIKKYLLE